jgi:hypothetical protein
VRLLVDPAVGPVDPGSVARVFLEGIGRGPGAEQIMSAVWTDAGLLEVERRAPVATASGKILHLHLADGRDRESPAR